jgi:hypothetical protein
MPWSKDPGEGDYKRMTWDQFALAHTPIPLAGAAGYIYDELRNHGASVTDTSMWMRAAMVGALASTTGIDPKPIKDKTPHRTRYGHAQVGH